MLFVELCAQEIQNPYLGKSYFHLPTSPPTQIAIATKKIAGASVAIMYGTDAIILQNGALVTLKLQTPLLLPQRI